MPNNDSQPVASFSFSETAESSSKSVLLGVDNYGLIQALDLLPDELLHELLQEGRSSANIVGNIGTCASGTPTLSNSSLDEALTEDRQSKHQHQHTPTAILSIPASSTEEKKGVVCDCRGCCFCGQRQQRASSPLATPVHHRLSCWKRQRNSLASLRSPSSSPPEDVGGSSKPGGQLPRAHSSLLPTYSSVPYAQPSASQLLFVSLVHSYQNQFINMIFEHIHHTI